MQQRRVSPSVEKHFPPAIAHWLRKVEEVKKMEDLILTAQHKQEAHKKTWDIRNVFIDSDEGQRLLVS